MLCFLIFLFPIKIVFVIDRGTGITDKPIKIGITTDYQYIKKIDILIFYDLIGPLME